VKEAIFRFILVPLIRRDLRLRVSGRRADKWYWADILAARWGMWGRADYPQPPKARTITVHGKGTSE